MGCPRVYSIFQITYLMVLPILLGAQYFNYTKYLAEGTKPGKLISREVFLPLSTFFTFMCAWSWHACSTSDPGYVPKQDPNMSPSSEKTHVSSMQCLKCNAIRFNDRVHHCSKCQRCIYNMDHHCYWVNNCVGYYNRKHMFLFNFYLAGVCFLNTIVLIDGFHFKNSPDGKDGLTNIFQMFSTMVLFMYSLVKPGYELATGQITHQQFTQAYSWQNRMQVFNDMHMGDRTRAMNTVSFLIGAVTMMYQILYYVNKQSTQIDWYKGYLETKRVYEQEDLTFYQKLQDQLFGSPFNLSWFIPTKPPMKINLGQKNH